MQTELHWDAILTFQIVKYQKAGATGEGILMRICVSTNSGIW